MYVMSLCVLCAHRQKCNFQQILDSFAAPAASLLVRKCIAAIAILFHADVWVVRAIWDHCCTRTLPNLLAGAIAGRAVSWPHLEGICCDKAPPAAWQCCAS